MEYSFLLYLLVCVAGTSCVIWGPEDRPSSPSVVEFDQEAIPGADEELRRLFRRSVDSSSVGHAVALSGDFHHLAVVHWTGHPSESIFILTRDSRYLTHTLSSWLWRSTDYGITFQNETSKWDNNTVIEWYYISPDVNKLIFADVLHQVLWVTTDEGSTYTKYPVPFVPDHIVFQSSGTPGVEEQPQSDMILGFDRSSRGLWVSGDLGANWVHLDDNVTEFRYFWRVLDSSVEVSSAVYYEKALNANYSRVYNASAPFTQPQLYPGLPPILSNSLYMSNEYMFVQISNYGNTNMYSSPLWVSRFRGTFQQAMFPLQDLAEEHYAVVDTSEGQVFIGVYHDLNNTNLYMSEPAGLKYSLSLEHVISPPESDWTEGRVGFDVHVVEGVVGTYFANVRTPNASDGLTLVSYDKGGNWLPLTPPLDSQLTCQLPACSLHLHIRSSGDYQSILTKKSAIGVILAQGNVGPSLSNSQRENGLYSSRDGGFTWTKLDNGFKHFRFAGLGSVVVWVDYRRTASYADWSCHEGLNAHTFNFLYNSTLETIFVVGMLTERGEKARHVTLFGYRRQIGWYVFDLDFTGVVTQQCGDSDFITWIPSDDRRGRRCLLGEHLEYERRNSSVCCYQDPTRELVVGRTLCPCVLEDFECDFGFERVNLDSPCLPSDGFKWPPIQPDDCPPHTYYNITSGYRKIAGDKCVPGADRYLFPTSHPCLIVSDSVQLMTSSTSPIKSGNIVSVGTQVSFRVTKTPDSELIFPDVVSLTWYIIPPRHASCPETTQVHDVLSHSKNVNFSCWGGYNISVQGNLSDTPFVLTTYFIAENVLASAEVNQSKIPVVARSGASLTLQLVPRLQSGALFEGVVRVMVVDSNRSVLLFQELLAPDTTSLQVVLTRDSIDKEVKTFNIFAFNNFSSITLSLNVTLAVEGQYGALRLRLVSSEIPGFYSSADMEKKLREAVLMAIGNYVKHYVPGAFVEVESVRVESDVVYDVRRQSKEAVLVDINILPTSLHQQDVGRVLNVSDVLVNSGLVVVVIDGVQVKATVSNRREIIVETEKIINRTLYIGLGAGLGMLVVVIMGVAISLGVIIYVYRSKYNRLNVRYSRLRQTPVRFTFTQGGEMMEDEDYEGEQEGVEIKSDD